LSKIGAASRQREKQFVAQHYIVCVLDAELELESNATSDLLKGLVD